MKVLMLGWELPPHFVGGMGVVCYNLCEYLAKSGADIEFILPFEGDYSGIDFMKVNPDIPESGKKISYKDLEVVNANAYGKHDISYDQARSLGIMPQEYIHNEYLKKVARVSLHGEYDVIHAHDWLTMRAAILAKNISGLPLIVHVHATEFDRSGADDNSWGDERIHEIEYQGMLLADKVIAVSEHTKRIIVRRYGIDADKIQVIHNSVDLDSPYLHANDTDHDDYAYIKKMKEHGYKVVLNVGRHTIQKGLTHLLDAAKLAIDKNPKLLFIMVGSGDQHHELIERAADLGIADKVIFTGFHSGAKVRDAFEVSDVFVMPSVSEPFGTTPMEAMSFGTPVVISKQSGVSEAITTGFTVDFWDIKLMADRIVALSKYESLAEHMSQASRTEAYNFTFRDPAEKTKQAYKEMMGVA